MFLVFLVINYLSLKLIKNESFTTQCRKNTGYLFSRNPPFPKISTFAFKQKMCAYYECVYYERPQYIWIFLTDNNFDLLIPTGIASDPTRSVKVSIFETLLRRIRTFFICPKGRAVTVLCDSLRTSWAESA